MDLLDRDKSTYKQVNLIVTGTNFTLTRGVGLAYQCADGSYRMRFNLRGTTSSATSSLTLLIAGVAFKSDYAQALAYSGSLATGSRAYTGVGNGYITINVTSTTEFRVSGDVELNAKPDWME